MVIKNMNITIAIKLNGIYVNSEYINSNKDYTNF